MKMEYNEKLKELRVSSNMSQEQLAEQLHVTRQTVSKWEQGVNQPDIYTLKQYATLFNVSLDELVGDGIDVKNPSAKRRKTSKILFLISTLFYIFSVMLVFVLWRFLQDTIPAHYNILGEVDRYGNKAEVLLHLISVTVLYAIALITFVQGRKNLGSALPSLCSVSFVVLFSVVLAMQIGYLTFVICFSAKYLMTDRWLQFVYCVIGALVFVIGIATHPKITPQNNILGVRTGFTLTNSEAWDKTNKMASICMPVAALLMIAVNMLATRLWLTLASTATLLIAAAVVYIYQAVLKNKLEKKN